MLIIFDIFITIQRLIIFIILTIEFKNTINIISITETSPAKVAMYHFTCVG